MAGKNKCKILKDIRREIAKQNDIDLVIEECKFKGECLGTCPRCESEVHYLERELKKRRSLGKKVAVAGLVVTLATTTACSLIEEPDIGGDTAGIIAEPSGGATSGWYHKTGKVSFSQMLFKTGDDRTQYLSGFSRDEIRESWQDYLVSPSETSDIFDISTNKHKYKVTVEYTNNGTPSSIEIIDIETGKPYSAITFHTEAETEQSGIPSLKGLFSSYNTLAYIKEYSREELRGYWLGYCISKTDKSDKYTIPFNREEYDIEIYYDDESIPTKIEIKPIKKLELSEEPVETSPY